MQRLAVVNRMDEITQDRVSFHFVIVCDSLSRKWEKVYGPHVCVMLWTLAGQLRNFP